MPIVERNPNLPEDKGREFQPHVVMPAPDAQKAPVPPAPGVPVAQGAPVPIVPAAPAPAIKEENLPVKAADLEPPPAAK